MMMDFIEHGSRDPFLFVEYANSYYNFMYKVEKLEPSLSKQQVKLLELFSKEINNSKRVEESLIMKFLIESEELTVKKLKDFVQAKYQYTIADDTIKSCITNLNFEFIREKKDGKMLSAKEIYNLDVLGIEQGKFVLSSDFIHHLNQDEFKLHLLDSTDFSIYEFDRLFDAKNWQKDLCFTKVFAKRCIQNIKCARKPCGTKMLVAT